MKKGVVAAFGIVLTCAAVPAATASGLEEPGCDALTAWANSLQRGQTFELRPGVAVSTLFQDDRLVPLFGKPISAWGRDDVGALRARAGQCRKEAYGRKDKASGEALYAVMKLAQRASRDLRPVWTARIQADRTIERLVAQRPSPEVAEILAIARDALAGQEVRARVAALPGRYQGTGRRAAELGDLVPMLTSAEIATHTTRLEKGLAEAGDRVAERQQAHAALLREIMSIPPTDAGYARLKRISHNTDRNAMSREELAAFNQAMTRKTNEIRGAAAERRVQAAAEAKRPIDLVRHLAGMLAGEGLRTTRLGGLHPGLPRERAVTVLRGPSWRLDHEGGVPSVDKFVPRRQDGASLKSERRSGAWVALDVDADERVGQIAYEEHFRARVHAADAERWLIERLGTPDGVRNVADGRLLRWRDGDRRMEVLIANRVDMFWHGAGYASRLAVAFWDADHEAWLSDVNRRCDAIREKPRNAWSMNDAQFFGAQCPMGSGARRTAGL